MKKRTKRSGKESASSDRDRAVNPSPPAQSSGQLHIKRSLLKRKWPLEDISKVWLIMPPLSMALLAILVVAAESLFGGPVVNTPLDAPRAVANDWRNDSIYSQRLWGSYRSNVYFGMRPRIPKSLVSGLMWFMYNGQFNIRHTCEDGDLLQRYGWIRHDGTSLGQQEIIDNAMSLKTDFMIISNTVGDTWTARIRADSPSHSPCLVSFILYIYNEGDGEMAFVTSKRNTIEDLYGHTPEFTEFRVHFHTKKVSKDTVYNYMSVRRSSLSDLAGYMKSAMRLGDPNKDKGWPTIAQLPGDIKDPDDLKFKPNLVAYQITTYLPFEIDMVFELGVFSATLSISGDKFTNMLASRVEKFDRSFEDVFQLKTKGYNDSEVNFAKATFSNLIGGISYFYGQSKVISGDKTEPLDYWPAPLYTAVPSRSFPRGFLWDEGFHQLLVAHWDTSIVKDVIAHWLDLMNEEGWIPREQILGAEARSKVPAEFVVQHSENASPPTFFLTLETLLQQMQREDKLDLAFLRRIYPRLEIWFQWFNTTQAGEAPFTYRWRGRNGTKNEQLIPTTLASGFNDFPRASHPTSQEYHLDLRCWMTLASGVMAKIANHLGEDSWIYWSTHKFLSDKKLLDKLHWDSLRKMYSDYGLHTPAVKLVRVPSVNEQIPSTFRRRVMKEPILRFINNFGYVNLFPFLLKQLSPFSKQLGFTLDRVANTSLLWSNYGLRSLSKVDPFYNKYNTEHDAPCWRGTIWININYLACGALHHYGNVEGPHRQKAGKLYKQLRYNLVNNIYWQYIKSGYIWEQYDDQTGQGKGTHPFTGWSSLIVLIMAEKY